MITHHILVCCWVYISMKRDKKIQATVDFTSSEWKKRVERDSMNNINRYKQQAWQIRHYHIVKMCYVLCKKVYQGKRNWESQGLGKLPWKVICDHKYRKWAWGESERGEKMEMSQRCQCRRWQRAIGAI
jgi:hypothetical protein